MFLELCEMYLKKHEIKNPIVVELGVKRNKQKRFYEELLGAEHIGIDISDRSGIPDILGNTHDPETMEALKKKLQGRPINILFIDACHFYEDVKQDFEMYEPLCSDIIVLHDIMLHRREVGKFWGELRKKARKGIEEYRNFLFLSIYQHRKDNLQLGIGIIIKT